MHLMKLNPGPFEDIKSGKKKIEIRLNDNKRQKLQIGDLIEFCKLPELSEKMEVEVISLLPYNSFKELMSNTSPEDYGSSPFPGNFLDDIYNIYTKEQEDEWGVLGIKIELKQKH